MSNVARWSHSIVGRLLRSVSSRRGRCIWKSTAKARRTQSVGAATEPERGHSCPEQRGGERNRAKSSARWSVRALLRTRMSALRCCWENPRGSRKCWAIAVQRGGAATEVAQVSQPAVSPISNRHGVETPGAREDSHDSQAGSTATSPESFRGTQVGKPALRGRGFS